MLFLVLTKLLYKLAMISVQKITLIVMIITTPFVSHSYFFQEYVDQTVIGPLSAPKETQVYTPALGIGNYQRDLGVQKGSQLDATNQNFILIGLDIDGINSSLALPFKDPMASRESRVDSESLRLQLSSNISESTKVSFQYNYAKGFYEEFSLDGKSEFYRFPQLKIDSLYLALSYFDNPKHTSFLYSPVVFKRTESNSSWIYEFGVQRYSLSGIQDLKNSPNNPQDSELKSATLEGVGGQVAYSRVAFWKHWFLGGAAGMTMGLLNKRLDFADSRESQEWVSSSGATLGFSFGYTWKSLTTGLSFSVRTLSLDLDKYQLSSKQGSSVWYFSRTL